MTGRDVLWAMLIGCLAGVVLILLLKVGEVLL